MIPCVLPFLQPARGAEDLEIAEFHARAGNMTATAISKDGQFVFTGEDDGLVTLWNVNTSGTASVRNFKGHFPRQVIACALLSDGRRAVSCGDDDMIDIWDLDTGGMERQMSTGNSIPVVMSCSTDGSLAAAGCDDGQIFIWNIATGRRVATLPYKTALCGIQFSPDGKLLAAGYFDGRVIIWDTAKWSARETLPDSDHASVGALAFSPDGKLLATGNQNGGGFVWNTADGSQLTAFAGYANPEATPSPPVAPVFPGSSITPDERNAIVFLCFSPDGSMLLGSVQDNAPRFWDPKTGSLLGYATWYVDEQADEHYDIRFYMARFGFTFSTAAITPKRDFIVLMKENLAQVWRCPWTPNPTEQ